MRGTGSSTLCLFSIFLILMWLFLKRIPDALRSIKALENVLDGKCDACSVHEEGVRKSVLRRTAKDGKPDEPQLCIDAEGSFCLLPFSDRQEIYDLNCLAANNG